MPVRLLALAALVALPAAPLAAQAVPFCADASEACAAYRGLAGAALPADTLSAAADSAAAFRQSDAVLRAGAVDTLAVRDSSAAFAWALEGDRRVVAVNAGAAAVFVELPGSGVPDPLVPVFVSRADAGRVPSLVALLDDDRATYGLRVPARSAVVYRPADLEDVRPRGLDE